jgi:hypothetical protein
MSNKIFIKKLRKKKTIIKLKIINIQYGYVIENIYNL